MKKRLILLLVCLLLAACFAASASAWDYLDEMQRYDVAVTLQEDGSAIIEYSIDWKVLDDSSYGPLEWVKIGVPNAEVTDLKILSQDSIRKIGLMWEDGDVYARIDLNRSYYEDETVNIRFSLCATYLYTLEGTAVNVAFTPGWFSEAETRAFSMIWQNADGQAVPELTVVTEGENLTQTKLENGGVKLECQNIPADGRFTVTTQYQTSDFAAILDPALSAENLPQPDDDGESDAGAVAIILFLLLLFLLSIVVSNSRRNRSRWHGGFGTIVVIDEFGRRRVERDPHYHGGVVGGGTSRGQGNASPKAGGGESRGANASRRSGGSSSGGGCACACACVSCACACACAGGGRAGCSAKQLRGYDAQGLLAVLNDNEKKEELA